jgi:hypothetical protein
MAQQVTTPFCSIYPRVSDGHEVVSQKGIQIRNAPTAQQLDRTPNAEGQSDYYRVIEKDEQKHVDWRKKLGGMLLREIGGNQHEEKWSQCILYELPQGYRLYEHIKSKADGQARAVKNHSGGGHDRQDAYLYGYPQGPKKRFRSPVEFFPHLLWLCTDETRDYENCTCKMCSPVQLEAEKPAARTEAKAETPSGVTIKKEGGSAAPSPAPVAIKRDPVVQIPPRRPSTSTAPSRGPAMNNLPRPHPSAPTPTPLPQPRSIDQQLDGQYNKFLVRTGEVTWFNRDVGAWGLGLVVRRWLPKNGSSSRAYKVQPLSHPFEHPGPQIVVDDSKLKPWLAWSAPSCTFSFLKHARYEQVDWRQLMSNQWGEGNPEVDASILATKNIDASFTLFERIKTFHDNGQEVRHWNGIYFGAEKIWNGEPVRLRIGSGNDVMVVTMIVERITSTPPNNVLTSAVSFLGDVYTYATLPAPDPNSPPTPDQRHIPIRMREDMRWRNQSMVPLTHTFAYWNLVAVQQRLEMSDIKGRWYETSLVFAESFQQAIKKKEGGSQIWMNSRGDASGIGNTMGIRHETRIAAFSTALPKNTQLTEGIEEPDPSEMSRPPTSEMHNLGLDAGAGPAGSTGVDTEIPGVASGVATGLGTAEAPFALDEFMNLDGIEHSDMAFDGSFPYVGPS